MGRGEGRGKGRGEEHKKEEGYSSRGGEIRGIGPRREGEGMGKGKDGEMQ